MGTAKPAKPEYTAAAAKPVNNTIVRGRAMEIGKIRNSHLAIPATNNATMLTCKPEMLTKWFKPNGRNACHSLSDSALCSPILNARIRAMPSRHSAWGNCCHDWLTVARPINKTSCHAAGAKACRSLPTEPAASIPRANAHASRSKPRGLTSPMGARKRAVMRHWLPAAQSR